MEESKTKTIGQPDWILLGATLALLAIGMMMVYSASSHLSYVGFKGDATYYLKRQLMWLGIGLVVMLVVIWLPHEHWMKLSIPIMAVTIFLLLLLLVLTENGRNLIGRSVSPAELAKLAVVVYIGHWLSSKGDLLRRLPYGLLPFTIMVGVVAGLVVAQPDLSEALVIVLVSVAMFFLAGADLRQFLIGILGGIATFVLVVLQIPDALGRIRLFLADWQNPLLSGVFQLAQGILGIGRGGLLGLGPGSGRMKFGWLPFAHTDSIFAIVGEELGLIGCFALFALFALVTYRGLRIASRAPDSFGALLAAGMTCWIAFQAFINVAVVTGTMPYTGIALPFISVGGSSLITCMIGVGIVLSISRTIPAEGSQA